MTIRRFKDLKIERLICNLLIVTSLCLLLPTILFAQVDTAWVRRYNGPGNSEDRAYAIAVDGQGNVYVTGYSCDSDTSYDYVTIKYNSSGVEQWVQRYNGPVNGNDYASSIAVDNSGNVYVTGWSAGDTIYPYNFDYATIKYNSAGIQEWVQRYNGPGNANDSAYAIVVDNTGNVYITGQSYGAGTANDYATIKYNTSGVQEWVQRYNGPGNGRDKASSIAIDGLGNVYVTGGSQGDYATIKYNSSGVEQWVQRYNRNYDYAKAIAVDEHGNVSVTGIADWGTYPECVTVKYNSNGVQEWDAYNEFMSSSAIALDNSGNVYVAGAVGMLFDYIIIKYNSNGDTLWVRRYNGQGNGHDYAYAIAVDPWDNVYVTGSSDSNSNPDTTNFDYATIKYNSVGVQQWVQRYNGPGDSTDYANAIAIDGQGNVYVTGYSEGSGTYSDYTTIKYVQTAAIEENHLPFSADRLSLEVYPNPVRNYFTMLLPSFNNRIIIFDVSGKIIRELKNMTQEMKVSLDNIENGVYFIKTDNSNQVTKIIVTK